MHPAVITFKNAKPENGDKTITVTPIGSFEAPLTEAVTDTTVYIGQLNNTSNSVKYTVSDSYIGGIGITGDTGKVTVSMVNKEISISIRNAKQGDDIKIGITNGTDTSKVSIVNINNIGVKKYKGDDVWCYESVFIAPRDTAKNVTWHEAMAIKCPDGWRIPNATDMYKLTRSTKEPELRTSVFSSGFTWTSRVWDSVVAYVITTVQTPIPVDGQRGKASTENTFVRCVAD